MPVSRVSVQIAQGSALSSPVFLTGPVVGITVPANWTGEYISFLSCIDGATFRSMFGLNELVRSVEPGIYLPMAPAYLGSGFWLQIRSGTEESPVDQTATGGVELILTIEG